MPKVLLDVPRFSDKPFGMQIYFEHTMTGLRDVAPPGWEFSVHALGLRGYSTHRKRQTLIDPEKKIGLRWMFLPLKLFPTTANAPCPSASFLYGKIDLLHSFGFHWVPRDVPRLITTIQDVAPLVCKEDFNRKETENRLLYLSQISDFIVTISQFSKQELVRVLGVPEHKVGVVYDGVDHDFFGPISERDVPHATEFLNKLGIVNPYILYVGGTVERKNIPNLLRAFAILKEKYKIKHKLVMIGPARDSEFLINYRFSNDVISPGHMQHDEKFLRIMQMADLLVFPSFYEGFGLPPLEAMSCGVPIAIANSSSLPEVGGSAAEYFNPFDPEDIAATVNGLLAEPGLREERSRQGIERSKEFSWHKAARELLEIYQQQLK